MYHSLLLHYQTRNYTARYRQLLLQLFSDDSILQLIPYSAIPLLSQYSSSGYPDPRLQALIPAFGMLFINAITPPYFGPPVDSHELRALAGYLASTAKTAFDNTVQKREFIRRPSTAPPPPPPRDWETTGCYYGHPRLRYRPFYENRDREDSTAVDAAESGSCRKYYNTYTKSSLTGGLMAFWCPHLVCLGFHTMPRSEGRNDVFSAVYTYFKHAPEIIVYDFACQLGTYCMSREPEFFKDTCFVIDQLHAKGHVGCSQASFASNYMQVRTDLQNLNTSAAECSNSGLGRIRKSGSYMIERNAVQYSFIYLNIWNRLRERKGQQTLVQQKMKLPLVGLHRQVIIEESSDDKDKDEDEDEDEDEDNWRDFDDGEGEVEELEDELRDLDLSTN
jgi:hypothetical protein